MKWYGKLTGGVLGLILGNWPGAIIGLVIGHQFDRGLARELGRQDDAYDGASRHRIQLEFFTATFSVMGHLAKADGRVSEDEIRAARLIMEGMNLSGDRVNAAIKLFNEGKRPDFPLDTVLGTFREACGRRRDLLRAFIEIQLQSALADGTIHPDQRRMLWRICSELGISRVEFAQLEAIMRSQGARPGDRSQPRSDRIGESYRVLGVPSESNDAAVKKAYRRLMNQHHPDKLVAKGLPEDMMEVAREKTREIRAAYDTIKAARGMR